MTNKKAIQILKDLKEDYEIEPKYRCVGFDKYDNKAIDMAIKALERQPILDKVRAEIAEYSSLWVEYKITGRSDKDIEQLVSDVLKQAKEQVLDVIDKYRKDGAE